MDGIHPVCVPLEDPQAFTGFQVPETHGIISTPGQYIAIITAQTDGAYPVCMSLKNSQALPCLYAPEPDGFIITPGQRIAVVATQMDGVHRSLMPSERP